MVNANKTTLPTMLPAPLDGVVSSPPLLPLVVVGTFVVVGSPVPAGGSVTGAPEAASTEQTALGNSSKAKMRWLLRPMDIFCSIAWNFSVKGSKYRISGIQIHIGCRVL